MTIRRRKWGFFDELFDDLEREITEMEENMSTIFKEAHRISLKTSDDDRYHVCGFSMYVGRDGNSYMEEFEDTPEVDTSGSKMQESMQDEGHLSEIIEGEKEISIIIELPGIEQKDIELNVTEDKFEMDVNTEDRRYHKVLDLPCKVKPETKKETYKNGILAVKIRRARKKLRNARAKVECFDF